MKGKIALLMATVMAATSFSAVTMAASSNSVKGSINDARANEILVSDVGDRSVDLLNTQEGIDSIVSGTPVSLQIRPTSEVSTWDESILIFVENGKFDERLINADPFIFRTKETGKTYDELMADERDHEDVLKTYVGGEGSRELPYGVRYIDEEIIEIYLYPIGDDKVNKNNSDVTQGVPIYNIALPITTEGSTFGYVRIDVDSNDSAISRGSYIVAGVGDGEGIPVWGGGGSSNSLNKSGFRLGKDEVLISDVENNSADILDTQEGINSLLNGETVSIDITPTKEVDEDTTIILNVENGKFDERLLEAVPFKFSTKNSGKDYKELMSYVENGESLYSVIKNYIGGENSRQLPYEYKYINDTQIEVTLFPISEAYVNSSYSDITQGVAYYKIALPITTVDSEYGTVNVELNGNNTIINSGSYTVARVVENPDEIEVSPVGGSSINTISKGNMHIDKDSILIDGVDNNGVDILDTEEGIVSLSGGKAVELQIMPKSEIKMGDSIILIAQNGKFDEKLINALPFKFKTKKTQKGYDELIAMVNDGMDADSVLSGFVGGEDSRQLPYSIKYINETQIEVLLYPISENKVYQLNKDVTNGMPYYSIALPLTSEGSKDGALAVGIYTNNTSVAGGSYTVAAVGNTDIISDGGSSNNSISKANTKIYKDCVLIRNLDNNSIDILDDLENLWGPESLEFGEPVKLQIRPAYEVEDGSTIILKIKNGRFDERLIDQDPYIFKTVASRVTYDELMADKRDPNTVLTQYIGNENSRNMPYGLKYISPEMIEVSLYPIDDVYVNRNNSSVTMGIPFYNIALPVTSEGSELGDIRLSVDSNGTVIKGGEYIIGSVIEYVETTTESTTITSSETTTEETTATETTTETTSISTEGSTETSTETASESTETTTETATETSTETSSESSTTDVTDSTETTTDEATETTTSTATEVTTDEATETTTRRVSSGGGGGGGSSSRATTTTTTVATTETTTDATTGEVTTEVVTEATTENLPEVRVSIGSSNIVVDNRTYSMDVAPYIQSNSNSTLVPLRFVAVALTGGNVDSADTSDIVSWDSSTKQAVISKDSIRVVFTAGSNIVTVNGQEMAMDHGVTAEIKNDRMFIPFRAMGEILGYGVEWDADTKTAIYNTAL